MQLVPLKMMANRGLFCGWPFERTKVNLQELEWPDQFRSCILSNDCWSVLHVSSVFSSLITQPRPFALVSLDCSGSWLMLNLMTLLFDCKDSVDKQNKMNAWNLLDSAFSVVTSLRDEKSGVRSWQEKELFSSKSSRPAQGPSQPPI